jgi:hypothetical protein
MLTSNTSMQFQYGTILCTSGCAYEFYGRHAIRTSYGGFSIAAKQWKVASSTYRGSLTAPAASGECYFAQNDGRYYLTAFSTIVGSAPALPYLLDSDGPFTSSSACRPVKQTCPGDPSCPPTGTVCNEWTPPEECQLSPIVINLGRGDFALSGQNDPVDFDITADGVPDRITWTARGMAMAFLALDRNRNHTNSGFGTAAANGFEALAAFDANRDSRVDAADPVWTDLLLWTDANHNGVSEADELQPVAMSRVTQLGLEYRTTRRHDQAGNMFKHEALLRRDGHADVYYDIYFVRVQ